MSRLEAIAGYGGRKPWLVWVMILALILLFVLAYLIYSWISKGGGSTATNLNEQIFSNTSLPI